jgi:hypothetical protein
MATENQGALCWGEHLNARPLSLLGENDTIANSRNSNVGNYGSYGSRPLFLWSSILMSSCVTKLCSTLMNHSAIFARIFSIGMVKESQS